MSYILHLCLCLIVGHTQALYTAFWKDYFPLSGGLLPPEEFGFEVEENATHTQDAKKAEAEIPLVRVLVPTCRQAFLPTRKDSLAYVTFVMRAGGLTVRQLAYELQQLYQSA